MNHKLIVILDACVLYPAPLRDLLMWLAVGRLYQPKWTAKIHDEWQRNLLAKRPDLSLEQLHKTTDRMNRALPDAILRNDKKLTDTLTLPDPDDRHVLAAAIKAQASKIITFNLRDFPKKHVSQHGVLAEHPDLFVLSLLQQEKNIVLSLMREHRSTLKKPPKTVNEYLETLSRQGLDKTVQELNRDKDQL